MRASFNVELIYFAMIAMFYISSLILPCRKEKERLRELEGQLSELRKKQVLNKLYFTHGIVIRVSH